MTKRFSNQVDSDSATPELQPDIGSVTSNNGLGEPVNHSEPRISAPFSVRFGGRQRKAEPAKPPIPQQLESRLRARAIAAAFTVTMLPVLAVGTFFYSINKQMIVEQAIEYRREGTLGLAEAESLKQRELQWLTALLIWTGATALVSGTLAAFWIDHFMRSSVATVSAAAQADAQARAMPAKLFTDIVAQIRASLKQEDILKTAVEETRKAIAADRTIVYSLDENSRGVVIAESVVPGWPRALPRALGTAVRDHYFEEVYLEKYQNGRVQAIDDVYEANLTSCHLEILETFAIRASLVAPLLNEEKLIGLLVAHQCSGPRVWQQSEIDLFTQIATQIGFALDNANLLTERASLKEQLDIETKWKQFFADTSQLIHASLSEEDVLKAAVEEARRVLAADRVLIYSLNWKSQGVVITESVAPGWPKAMGIKIDDPCFEARYIEKYEDGRVQALNNIFEGGVTECYIEQLENLAVKANLVVPVLHEGKLLGLLIAHQCSGPREWKPIEITWLSQIAIQVGFALDNIKLVSRIEQLNQDAETMTHEWRQEKAALRQQITAILSDSEAAFEAFSTQAARQAETVTGAIAQIQAISDAARSMTASTQKAENQLQQATQAVQVGHESVNQAVDSIAAIQDTFAEVTSKLKNRDDITQRLYQFISLLKNLVAQMNRQAINATIESGRNGDAFQHSVVVIAEAVRSITQQLNKAAADIEPTVAKLETEAEDMASAMDTGAKQVAAEMELMKQTRQNLNQLATISAKLSTLVHNIAEVAADSGEKSTFASNTVLEVANLTNLTSEQSAVVVKSFNKLAAMSQKL